jgi:serine/threonine protein kinase
MFQASLLFILVILNSTLGIPIMKIPIEVIDDHNFLVVIDERLYDCELPGQIVNIDNQQLLSAALCEEDIMLYKRCDDGESSVGALYQQSLPSYRSAVIDTGSSASSERSLHRSLSQDLSGFRDILSPSTRIFRIPEEGPEGPAFKCIQELGRGSYGKVYEAADEQGTKWAVKVATIPSDLPKPETVQDFANIIIRQKKTLESDVRGNELYGNEIKYHINPDNLDESFVVMPLVRGRQVSEFMMYCDKAKVSWPHFFLGDNGLLSAVYKKLHSKNIVHGDLNLHMGNVMVSVVGGKFVFEFFDLATVSKILSKHELTHEMLTTLMSGCFDLSKSGRLAGKIPVEVKPFEMFFRVPPSHRKKSYPNDWADERFRYTSGTGHDLNSIAAWDVLRELFRDGPIADMLLKQKYRYFVTPEEFEANPGKWTFQYAVDKDGNPSAAKHARMVPVKEGEVIEPTWTIEDADLAKRQLANASGNISDTVSNATDSSIPNDFVYFVMPGENFIHLNSKTFYAIYNDSLAVPACPVTNSAEELTKRLLQIHNITDLPDISELSNFTNTNVSLSQSSDALTVSISQQDTRADHITRSCLEVLSCVGTSNCKLYGTNWTCKTSDSKAKGFMNACFFRHYVLNELSTLFI